VSRSLPRRLLVTGGAGFIGRHSVLRLAGEEGVSLLVVDDLRHACGEPLPGSVELVVSDVVNAADTVAHFKPDAVLHLAAQGGVSRSVRDPAGDAQINVLGTVALLKACADAGCRRFIFASSGGAIYGHARRLPTRERTRPRPLSPYGAAKLAAEGYLEMFARTFRLSTLALRYANVYGPFQDGTGEAGVVAITCERLLAGRPPEIRGDGKQKRDFVFVGDVAEANLLALRSGAGGAMNIGTGVATTVAEVVDQLIGMAHYEGAADFVAGRPGEVRETALDSGRAARLLDWTPHTPLHHGLEPTFRSFQERAQRGAVAANRAPTAGGARPDHGPPAGSG
jgi:UDP-glucose 4-epimerase